MVKSPEQILGNYCQHAERSKLGFDSAKIASNADLAAFNLGQGLKAYLMQGLIGWRCGITSPVGPFREALTFVRQGFSTWQTMKGRSAARALHLPLEKATFVAFLVNETAITFDFHDLVAERLLDANLAHGLHDEWDEESWANGVEQLRQTRGSTLAVETYTTYYRLLRYSHTGDVKVNVERAVLLFEKRKSNSFYSGGEQTDGGGDYNAITVDYRLATIMKKVRYKSDSIHSWRWE